MTDDELRNTSTDDLIEQVHADIKAGRSTGGYLVRIDAKCDLLHRDQGRIEAKLDELLALLRPKEWPGWARETADGKPLSAEDLARVDELMAGVEGDQAAALEQFKAERAAMDREYVSMHNAAQWEGSSTVTDEYGRQAWSVPVHDPNGGRR